MEINGLPLHPLIVHAVVILGPLAGLTGLAYAFVPKWRWLLRWPLVALSLVVATTALDRGPGGPVAPRLASRAGADSSRTTPTGAGCCAPGH